MVQPWEVDAQIRARKKNGECLHAGGAARSVCGKPAIGSHTVTKKMLKQIAQEGHVYSHSAVLQELKKTAGKLAVKSIGINDASVVPVFCHIHDNNTFSPLEKMPFVATQEQCFLLAYRAVCHELAKKKGVSNFIPTIREFDSGMPLLRQGFLQVMLDELDKGCKLSMRDMDEHKEQFDSMLIAQDYTDIRAFIVSFENLPDILCSGAHYPQCDFAGNQLQDLSDFDKKMELMTFSLIATDNAGAFVFAWHKDSDDICRPLASSLDRLPNEELSHAIIRFVFEFCENHYLRPEWWDTISADAKDTITGRFQTAASPGKREKTCLIDDGFRAVSWKISERKWL